MTEAEWDACDDPQAMLEFLEGRASDRKLRLLACACCRRGWRLKTDPSCRNAVEAAERFVDGLLTVERFHEALAPVVALWAESSGNTHGEWGPTQYMAAAACHLETGGGTPFAADFAARGLAAGAGREGGPEWDAAVRAENLAQCGLIRDLFGNPNVPFRFDAAWLSGSGNGAVACANEIYREGDFRSLSSLADVLEQAGCTNRAVLDHCRRTEAHARGCWVVDALLGWEAAVRVGLMTQDDWRACRDPEPLLRFLLGKGSSRKWRLLAVACCRRIDRLITDERSRHAVAVAARYADGAATEEEIEAARIAAQEAQDEAWRAEYAAEAEANFCITPAYAAVSSRLHAAAAARAAVCRDPRHTDAEPDSYEARRWRPSNWCAAGAVVYEVFAHSGGGQREANRHAAAAARAEELAAHCELLRDLFGEYLGPPGAEAGWLPFGPGMEANPLVQAEQWCRLPARRDVALCGEWLAWNDGAVRKMSQAIYDDCAFDRLPLLADALEEAVCDDAAILAHCRQPGEHVRGCWVVDLLLAKS